MTHDLGSLSETIAFLVAIMVLAQACADEDLFDILGSHMSRLAAGSSTRLLAWSIGLAAAVTAVLSLDATVVLLTPILIAATGASVHRSHAYASVRIANSGSLLLPVSNLTNLLVFAATGLTFVGFTWRCCPTSEDHPWFVESRSSRTNPKRDWYIWQTAAADGGPPNNWLSTFGGTAWEWDPKTEQYYYHAYLKQQPDLNWRNQEVQAAIHQAMRFWLDRHVDGFRIDVIWHLIKDDQFRANPPNPEYRPGEWPYRQFLATYTDRPS